MKKSAVILFMCLFFMGGVICPMVKAADKNPIKIGVTLPLSGPSASSGMEMRLGLIAALKEIENKGGVLNGRKIELIIEDNKGNTAAAIGVIEKLVTKDNVNIILGGISSTVVKAMSGPLKKYEPIYVCTGGSASGSLEQTFANTSDWFFHLHPWDHAYTRVIGEGLRDFGGLGKILIASEEGVWGTTTAEVCQTTIKAVGHQFVGRIPFKAGSSDFSGVIAQAKMKPHDYLVVFSYGADANVFIPQMRQLNYAPKLSIFALGGWPDNFGQVAAGENIACTGMWFYGWKLPEAENFVKSYTKTNGVIPKQYWAPLAYEALKIVAESIKRAGTDDKKAVAKALKTGHWNTSMGPLKFTLSKFGINDGYDYEIIAQWRKGRQLVVWPANLAEAKVVFPDPAWKKK